MSRATFLLGFAALVAAGWDQSTPTRRVPERFWLAAKYDGRQAMIYFDALQFGDSFPDKAEILYPAAGWGIPSVLTPAYIARFQKPPKAEDFKIGDKYDLVVDGNFVRSATITKLIGWPGDEGVGNDSYIGALVTIDTPNTIPLMEDWFVARRHSDNLVSKDWQAPHARLMTEPVPFTVQTRIASLMNERMRVEAPAEVQTQAAKLSPALTVQPFTLADGSLRYYVRCEWKPEGADPIFLLAAWMLPGRALRFLGLESRTAAYGFESDLPQLLNVLDLGDGRTGVIISVSGEDSYYIDLLEYRDGGIRQMQELQSVGSGE